MGRDATDLHGWPDEDELDKLRTAYPSWRIWRGINDHRQASGWYASRKHEIRDRELDDGLHRTAGADSANELRAFLQEQLAVKLGLTIAPRSS